MTKNKWGSWSWKIEPAEMEEQISKYNQLKITKSFRGKVVVFFSIIILLSVALSFFLPEFLSMSSVIVSAIIYGILLFFVFEGRRWAMIALLILWIVDKGYTSFIAIKLGGQLFFGLLVLLWGVTLLVRALKVENARKKMAPSTT